MWIKGEMPPLCSYNGLELAYMGDCVYEQYVREFLMRHGPYPVAKLHKMAKQYVSAVAQSAGYEKIKDVLTSEEEDVYRRGRNAKSYTSPKNTNIVDYRRATGVEALIGYLYLQDNTDRICELMERMVSA